MTAKQKPTAPPKAPKRVTVEVALYDHDNGGLCDEAPWTITPQTASRDACVAFVARLNELVQIADALGHSVLVARNVDAALTVSLVPNTITTTVEVRDDA